MFGETHFEGAPGPPQRRPVAHFPQSMMRPPQPSPAGPHSMPCSAHVSGLQFGSPPASGVGPESIVLNPPLLLDELVPLSIPFVSGLKVEESSDPHATIRATAAAVTPKA